jgi:hypothetical protein
LRWWSSISHFSQIWLLKIWKELKNPYVFWTICRNLEFRNIFWFFPKFVNFFFQKTLNWQQKAVSKMSQYFAQNKRLLPSTKSLNSELFAVWHPAPLLVAGPEQITRAELCYTALKWTGALITQQFTDKNQSLFPELWNRNAEKSGFPQF